ncbi:MAG TPA: sigma-70 family RNA polymerase sigma factor [Jatrophihabitantaceae bacterium]|nr:sigma-70 family RNA polymerase sigma factor [Jatrophihabitantaceae bacterium]
MIEAGAAPETLASRAARLFADFRTGDEAKMAELVGLLTPILWHTVRAQRLDRESAEDALQTVWLALVRSADSINDPQAVLQWLIVSARREAWRVVKREDRVEATDFEPDEIVAPITDLPEEMVLRSDGEGRLWQHISRLPERCQALLRVIAFADRPDYAAVADSLGMPVGSIGPTRGRCLAKLRQQLANDPGWESR